MHVHATIAIGCAVVDADAGTDFFAKGAQIGQDGRRAAIASLMNGCLPDDERAPVSCAGQRQLVVDHLDGPRHPAPGLTWQRDRLSARCHLARYP